MLFSVLIQSFGCNSPEELVNGVDLLSVKDNGRSFLSSSLEAEQRLLRQMGWNETEEDEYVITEDDKKEFQKLTNQVWLKAFLNVYPTWKRCLLSFDWLKATSMRKSVRIRLTIQHQFARLAH